MSPAQLDAVRALPSISAVAAARGPAITSLELEMLAVGRRQDRAREQLLDEVGRLAAGPLTVWRAYYRDSPADGFTIGLFRAEGPARAAAEDLVRCEQAVTNDTVLTWWTDADDPDDPRELAVTLPGAERAFGTGYFVVPVLVADSYDPEADR